MRSIGLDDLGTRQRLGLSLAKGLGCLSSTSESGLEWMGDFTNTRTGIAIGEYSTVNVVFNVEKDTRLDVVSSLMRQKASCAADVQALADCVNVWASDVA